MPTHTNQLRLLIILPMLCCLAFGQGATVLPKTTILPKTTVFPGAASGATPAFVQVCNAGNNAGSASTIACTFGTNVGAHHFLGFLVYWGASTGTVSSVTSALGLTYTILNSGANNSTNITTAIVYTCDSGSGGSETITDNLSGAQTNRYWVGIELSGNATSSCVDGTDNPTIQVSNGGSVATSASYTTTNAHDMLIGMFGSQAGSSPWTAGLDNQGNTYAIPVNGSNAGVALEYFAESAIASYFARITMSANSSYNAHMVAVHP